MTKTTEYLLYQAVKGFRLVPAYSAGMIHTGISNKYETARRAIFFKSRAWLEYLYLLYHAVNGLRPVLVYSAGMIHVGISDKYETAQT